MDASLPALAQQAFQGDTKDPGKSGQFVIKNATQPVLDLGDGGPVQIDPYRPQTF